MAWQNIFVWGVFSAFLGGLTGVAIGATGDVDQTVLVATSLPGAIFGSLIGWRLFATRRGLPGPLSRSKP